MDGQPQVAGYRQDGTPTREEVCLWRAEQIHTFKAVLQSVPMGTSAKVICSKVQAALLDKSVRKSFDQVRDKYYRVVKSLVEYLGSKMPPKPHKQAAVQALMLQHWDRIAYPSKRKRQSGQPHISVAGSLSGVEEQELQAAASKPEPAALTLHLSVAGNCSPCAPAAVSGRECGGAVTGSASEPRQQGAAPAQQQDQLWEQRLAPALATHSSSGLLACPVLEPQTPAETPPQLSRAFTAEGPDSCRASPQQPGADAPSSAQAHAAQSMACRGAQTCGGQTGIDRALDCSSATARKQGPAPRKAPKLALRVVPKDTETVEQIDAQGMPAYFELSCRGHKTMTALVAALEGQWGETYKGVGQRMLLWSTLGAVPLLCWGSLSPSEVTVGDIHRTLGQPEPFTLSYTLKAPGTAGLVAPRLPVPAADQADKHDMSQSTQPINPPPHPSMQSRSLADQAGAKAGTQPDAVHAQACPVGPTSYEEVPEACDAGVKESSAHGKPSSEGTAEPQAEAVHVRAEQLAAQESAGTGTAQEEASISGLDLFRPGATCSGFGTCLGLFREGATYAGFETSFSGLFGLKQAQEQDKAADSSAKSQLGMVAAPGQAGQTGEWNARKEGSIDGDHACTEDSAGEHSYSRGDRQAEAMGSQKEPLSFAGAFSKACKRKQPSRLSNKSKRAYTAEVEDAPPEQLDEGSKQQGRRPSRRKQAGAAGGEPSQPGASGRRHGNLPGGIFSEHTLAGLADGVPSHPSNASQLPIMADGDLPDNLPAEPLVFWPPAAQDALSDPGQTVQASEAPARLEDFQPSQLGSLLGNGNSWDAAPGAASSAAGAAFCTERPFAELFAQEII